MKSSIESVNTELVKILNDYLDANTFDDNIKHPEINPAINLVADLQLDSIQLTEFMLEVEEHFDFIMDLESQSNIGTLSDLADIIFAGQT